MKKKELNKWFSELVILYIYFLIASILFTLVSYFLSKNSVYLKSIMSGWYVVFVIINLVFCYYFYLISNELKKKEQVCGERFEK